MRQPCLDCGTPAEGGRCPSCTTSFARQRDARWTAHRKQKGGRSYGSTHRKIRGEVLAHARECWVCGEGPRPDDPMQGDHVIPISRGGEGGPILPAHRSCNIARSNKLRAGKPDPALERLRKLQRGGGRSPADQTDQQPTRQAPDDLAN